MSGESRGKELVEGSSRSPGAGDQLGTTSSRYESQKRRDWNPFVQYLKNQRPPVLVPQSNSNHVLEFLRYLIRFYTLKPSLVAPKLLNLFNYFSCLLELCFITRVKGNEVNEEGLVGIQRRYELRRMEKGLVRVVACVRR